MPQVRFEIPFKRKLNKDEEKELAVRKARIRRDSDAILRSYGQGRGSLSKSDRARLVSIEAILLKARRGDVRYAKAALRRNKLFRELFPEFQPRLIR